MNEVVRKTLRLVFSSNRAMPAHFTSNGERTQSFCIDFKPLTTEDDLAMASQSWGSAGEFLQKDISKEDFDMAVRCGEDVMLGAFIITKLGHSEMVDDVKKSVLEDAIDTFETDIPYIRKLLTDDFVVKYLNHCSSYGKERAESSSNLKQA